MVTPAYESVQSLGAHQAHRTWKQISHEGSWKRRVNAGGCSNNKGYISITMLYKHNHGYTGMSMVIFV